MQFQFIEEDTRPWGKYYVIHDEPFYKIKRIEVKPKQRLSYQYHSFRSESWTIVKGEATVTLDGKSKVLTSGENITIPLGAKHRIANNSDEIMIFIEVQMGTYFGEDDIVRLEDDYLRSK